MISQELFDAHAKERERSAKMSMKFTLERRDTWPDAEAAASYLRRKLPWKSWDSRIFDVYIVSPMTQPWPSFIEVEM
jgi:hypothetical protein